MKEVNFTREGLSICVDCNANSDSDTYIDLPLIYYKGYKAYLDNQELNVTYNSEGLVRVYINELKRNIEVKYCFTTVRKVGLVLTLFSLLAFISYNKQENFKL